MSLSVFAYKPTFLICKQNLSMLMFVTLSAITDANGFLFVHLLASCIIYIMGLFVIYCLHGCLCQSRASAAPLSVHCLATVFRFSTSRPFRANRAPSLANKRLVPAPIPELAPVIRTTFPFREDTWKTTTNKVGSNLHKAATKKDCSCKNNHQTD